MPVNDNPTTFTQGLTSGRFTPWWAWLLAASFLVNFGFAIYTSCMGPGPAGAATSDAAKGGALIGEVVPGTPLEMAGVRPGDIVVAVDGQAIRGAHDFGEMAWQFEPGKPFVLTVERDSERMQLTLLFPQRRVWQMRDRSQWLSYSLDAALALLYLGTGLVALFARPRDPGVVAGAVLLLMFANLLGPGFGGGTAALFRQLPFLLQAPVFILSLLLGGYLILLFAALWPRPVFRRRWVLPVLLLPALLMILNNVLRFYHRFYLPGQAISPGPPWAYMLLLSVEMLNVLAGLVVLALGYKRLKDEQARRGLRRVSFAALFSFGALVLFFLLLALESSTPVLKLVSESEATGFVFLVLWSIFPVVFARTVVRTGSPVSRVANSV